MAALDASFFRVRFDRLTPREQEYLRAMAQLGAGPHRSGEVAAELGVAVTSAGPIRTGLIRKRDDLESGPRGNGIHRSHV